MIAYVSAPSTPPNAPVTTRATSRAQKFVARPQANVPQVNPATSVSSAFLRSNRSIPSAASSPTTHALNVYDDTIRPNFAGVMLKNRCSDGSSGITIMKSMMFANCTAARISSRARSFKCAYTWACSA